MITRSAIGRSGEMLISPTASAAFCRQKSLFRFGKIEQLNHLSSASKTCVPIGTLTKISVAIFAGTIRAFAVSSAFGFVFGIVTQMKQSIYTFVRFEPDITADSAVAARRSAARNKFFAAKSRYAVSAVARFDSIFTRSINIKINCRILECGLAKCRI